MLLLSCSVAQAGTYSAPVYSTTDGAVTVTDPPYNSGNYPYVLTGSYYGGFGDDKPTNGSIVCQGKIKAVFTWQPAYTGDLPPTSVIVMQTSGASCGTYSGLSGVTGQASDGLGDPSSGQWGSGGTHYTVQAGSPTITLTCSPYASISTTQKHEITAGVSYSAAVYAPIVTPSGAKLITSGYNILVGQGCTGILGGIPPGCTVSNWQWGITGTTFQSWTVSTDQSHTTEVDGPGRSDQPTANWYWNDNNGSGKSNVEYVTCTATVTPPTSQGSAFSVTAKMPVTVWVPGWTSTGTGGGMYVTKEGSANSPDYWLRATATPGSGELGGMNWVASVISPLPGTFGDRTAEIVQLIIPGITFRADGEVYYQSNNGVEGLDTIYPYTESYPTGSVFISQDSPGLSLTNVVPAAEVYSAILQDTFEDYLLFTPPGSSQCVPLARFVWSTDGQVIEPLQNNVLNWAFYGSGSAGTVSPTGLRNFVQTNSFPLWTQNSGNGTSYWEQNF